VPKKYTIMSIILLDINRDINRDPMFGLKIERLWRVREDRAQSCTNKQVLFMDLSETGLGPVSPTLIPEPNVLRASGGRKVPSPFPAVELGQYLSYTR
jgi:hypothetical protein